MATNHCFHMELVRVVTRLLVTITVLVAVALPQVPEKIQRQSALKSSSQLNPALAPSTPLTPALFLPPEIYYLSLDMNAREITVIDLDGDRNPDLLVRGNVNDSTGIFAVFINNGDGTFRPNGSYRTDGQAVGELVVADINGDGKPDVVAPEACADWLHNCNPPESLVAVLLNNGDGTFQPAVFCRPGGVGAWSLAVGDLNADAKPDLAVADHHCTNSGFDGCVSVLLGNGDGTFQPSSIYASGGSNAEAVTVADLNGDGQPDLMVTNNGGPVGTIGVLLGKRDGSFQPATVYATGGTYPRFLTVADLNHDRKPDLLGANTYFDDTLGVLLNKGNGTFSPAVMYSSGGKEVRIVSLVARDVNQDNNLDLLVSNCGGFSNCGSNSQDTGLSVVLGNDDGTFRAPLLYRSNYPPSSLTVADVNLDGLPDIITGGQYPQISVMLGYGDGNFATAVPYDFGPGPGFVTSADLNADDRPDLAVIASPTFYANVLLVRLNDTPFCTASPLVMISATPSSLWPPNGKKAPVRISGTITGNGCAVTDAAYAVKDEYGEVQPSGPVTLGAEGAYSFTVWLRAARPGTDRNGRLYTVTVSASNNAGKTGSQAAVVIVPHDQGH